MRPPSSGGIGNRFNAINTRLTMIPYLRHLLQAVARPRRRPAPRARSSSAQSTAITKLAAGPAAATQIMSRFGLRRLPKLTGTGLAQPNRNGAPRQQQHARHQHRPDRVDVLQRVQRNAAQHPGRLVAEQAGDIAVGGFMQGDREDHRHGHERDGLERKIHIAAAFYPSPRRPARRSGRRLTAAGSPDAPGRPRPGARRPAARRRDRRPSSASPCTGRHR